MKDMPELSRREFLRNRATDAIVVGFLAASATDLGANPLGLPIGSQTYPHRQMIKDGNFAGLAKALAEMGVQTVEMCSPFGYSDFASLSDGKQVRKILADHGLACESAHFSMRELREKQSDCIAWARDVGITQMITASLGAGITPTMDDVKKAEYFTKYPGRFFSMHLQDIDLNATPAPGGAGVQVPIGKGSIDWVKTFSTAKAAGVRNYFVEQTMELTRESVAALKTMKM
jgi:sugar phosphate isomerase/epimerase